MQPRTALLGVLIALAPLAACSVDAADLPVPDGSNGVGVVDVATPELAELRERTGIEPCSRPTSAVSPREDGLPALELPCLGGGSDVDLAQLRDVPLVVNLWASWCLPCRAELPLFQRLQAEAGTRIRMLGVDFADPDPAAALRLAAATEVTYQQVADTEAQLQAPLRINGLPVTVFVDADGRISYTKVGPVSSYEELASLVRQHLEVTV